MTAGVGLFGTLSGYLANTFLTPPRGREEPAGGQPDDPKARLAQLQRMLEAQEQSTAAIKAKLAEIGKLL